MQALINFSHPLSAEVLAEIEAVVGDRVEEYRFSAQFDLTLPSLQDQVLLLGDTALETTGGRADLVVPPALSAAAYLMALFLNSHNIAVGMEPVKAVWLRRADGIPPKFVLGGIE